MAKLWLLDSNTISEAAKERPDPLVLAHLAEQSGRLALPAIVLHELRYGWLRMPEGRRKTHIGRFVLETLAEIPVLPYDEAAARIHAQLRHFQESQGRSLPFGDAQIAAIAIAQDLTLVTRNLRGFADLQGLRLANWFEA